MFTARDSSGNNISATPGARGWCPDCSEELIARCGEVNDYHWAHQGATDCDNRSQGMTVWHAEWQTAVPDNRREIVVGRLRADAVAGDGVVCEFQHSPISLDDIRKRERGYRDMRWLFDATDKQFNIKPYRFPDEPDTWGVMSWQIHRNAAWKTIGSCSKRVMLDLGPDIGVLSCEKVNATGSWARGMIYPHKTIRMWLAGPNYRPGWIVPSEKNAEISSTELS